MEHLFCDVLIVGSGAAGLRAAISARQNGLDVCVISKQAPGKATCTILSAGVFAGTEKDSSPDSHLMRTLQAGRGINQQDLVKVLVEDAPQRLKELKEWEINADFQHGYLYCRGRSPYLGREIVRCLLSKNQALGTRLIGDHLVADLKPLDGFWGVLAYAPGIGKGLGIGAKALILCTGGAGALYLRHDNPKRMFGDGYALALQAGAVLQDMEFVQFYPVGLAQPGLPGFLIPPRLADHGQLYNTRGEDILEKYGILERPAAERARDRLSQALFTEIYKRGADVFLDLRKVSKQKWCSDPFSASTYHILGERYGAIDRPMRVAPMAHHTMGGVCIDTHGATSVPGLFAAGEVTGGLHGANRMGGNALTETVVFGARAGEAAAAWAKDSSRAPSRELFKDAELETYTALLKTAAPDASKFMADLSRILWNEAGIIRNRHGLENALNAVEKISAEVLTSGIGNHLDLPPGIEILPGARVAALIIQAALKRQESRGAHFREDFADQDDKNWQGHLQVKQSRDGQAHWNFQAVS